MKQQEEQEEHAHQQKVVNGRKVPRRARSIIFTPGSRRAACVRILERRNPAGLPAKSVTRFHSWLRCWARLLFEMWEMLDN